MISPQVPQQTLLGIKGQQHHHHCHFLILKNNNNNNNANDNDQVPDLRYVGLFFESQSELLGRLNQQQCHGQITLAFAFFLEFALLFARMIILEHLLFAFTRIF